MDNLVLTPYGTAVVLLALVGAGFLASWVMAMLSQVLGRIKPHVQRALVKWTADRALRRALRNTPRMSEPERRAMQAGSLEAMAAFERAMAMARQ